MKQDDMLICIILFILGFIISRIMSGNGLSVGGQAPPKPIKVVHIHSMPVIGDGPSLNTSGNYQGGH